MGQVLKDSLVGYPEELAIFDKPIQNVGIKKYQCIDYYPVNDFTTQGIIQFHVPGNGAGYLDLSRTTLSIRCKIVKRDGTDVNVPADENVTNGLVSTANNFFSSIFGRVDAALQNKVLTDSDNSYAYQAYFKALLYSSKEMKEGTLQLQLYYPDTAGHMTDANWVKTKNEGLKTRGRFFQGSKEVDMTGRLYCDIFEITRLIPNGVPLSVTLYPAVPQFCLMSVDADPDPDYKVVITRACLNVCTVEVSPEIIMAHAEVMQKTPAIYPYTKTEIKKFTAAKGVYSVEINDPYQGRVPSEIMICVLPDPASHGSYKHNPFDFSHNGVNFVQVTTDGRDMSHGPIEAKYAASAEDGIYANAYKSLMGVDGFSNDIPISRTDFPNGYCIYRFVNDFDSAKMDDDIIPLKHTGNVRLSLKFDRQLAQPMTVLTFAKFPAGFKIDKNRAVYEMSSF